MSHPIIYSFRRCPYAMRARLAIAISGIQVELREVVLRNKPQALLYASPKATVPVLITTEDEIVDESIDIMNWALKQSDPEHWLIAQSSPDYEISQRLIANNDGDFKHWLDRYKYADRFPEQSETFYREQGEKTLLELETRLSQHSFLISNKPTQVDMALLPFIRQFASVDTTWFSSSPYPKVQQWLTDFCQSELFESIMKKYPAWAENDDMTLFPENL
jgi:glutathione S-transferase